MDKVAGSAGGTTIVIKSKARTTIKCHASYLKLAKNASNALRYTYVKPNEVYEGGNKANCSNPSHDGYITKSILIELET